MNEVRVTMPQLGETVAEGTVSRWLVGVGGEVRVNEPLLEVSTDEVDTEVVSPVDGILTSVAVGEAETVPVGTLLATVDIGGAAGQEAVPDADRVEPGPGDAAPVAATNHGTGSLPKSLHLPPRVAPSSVGRRPRHRDSPRVRRLARERGVNLNEVARTGQHGRATAEDVAAAVDRRVTTTPARPATAPSVLGRVAKLSRRRWIVADRMVRSLRSAAQLTTVVEVDMTAVARVRGAAQEEFRRRHGAPLTVLAFVAEAAVHALGKHSVLNARLDTESGTVTYPDRVNLGVAIDTEEGLIVPIVHRADELSLAGLARRIAELAQSARGGKVAAGDLSDGTFTITNNGCNGALFDTPILNPPESATLGLGALVRRPAVLTGEDGEERMAIRTMAYLPLTYDHRLVDGAEAARFLTVVKSRLEQVARTRPQSVL